MNAQRNFDHDSDGRFGNMDEMLDEAEAVFRRGVSTLNEWTSQARTLLQNKPTTILGAAGLSGMVAGTLIRHSMAARRGGKSKDGAATPIDPVVLLAGGLALGLSVGPKLIEQAITALNRLEQGGEMGDEEQSTFDIDGARLRSTGSMNAKPFEK
jgi:hypothetical protein